MADQTNQGIQPWPNPRPPVTEGQGAAAQAPAPTLAAPTLAATQPPAMVERLDKLLVVLLLVLAFMIGSFAATNTDVWMHLASGRHIAEGEWTVGVDPFSYATQATPTRPAATWVQHSWLFSLIFYWLYNLIGGAGLVLLKALAVVALAACLLAIPGGAKDRFLAVIYVALAMLAISPQLLLRPMTLSLLFFGITLLTCYRAGALGYVAARPRVLWRLPLLFLLWANLDAWFIMGPLTLALLWAGTGLGWVLGIRNTFPGKTLAAVLAVGLLACLVNPHHVQVFMLPPELGLVIVRAIDVPDSLGAGGRALRNLQIADAESLLPTFQIVRAPFQVRYNAGHHVAGFAVVPLLILGLVAFIVNAAVTKKPGAPGLHPGRFLVWGVLAVLCVVQVRLIPWFAIASAPIALLNLADWRTWLSNIHVPNWRPALMGRALAVFLIGLLLFLAWPGWLHAAPGEMYSPRRVAWKMPADPSFQRAALFLEDSAQAGQGSRAFNLGPEIANYCAWFAPSVRCFLDTRWSLFPDDAARFVKARKGLAVNEPEGWQETFLDGKVDCLVLTNFPSSRDGELTQQLWKDELHWLQKYADGKTVIFAWSGPDKTFGDEFHAELTRAAFGPIPDKLRAPAKAPAGPLDEASVWAGFWAQYLHGQEPLPLAASEARLWLRYYTTVATSWQRPYLLVSQIASWAQPAGLGSLTVTLPNALHLTELPAKVYLNRYRSNNKLVLKARDFGPPAALVLMMRRIREAIAENPSHPNVYLILSDACKALMNDQEDHWANYRGEPALMQGLRSTLRQIQIVTALTTYLELRPEDPQIHEQVGNIFLQLKFFDIALEHFQQSARNFDQYRPEIANPQLLEEFKNKKKALDKWVHDLEADVAKKREQYLLAAATKQGMDKFRLTLESNRGLALEAVNQLQAIKTSALSPQEMEGKYFALTQLLLMMGRAKYMADISPRLAEFRAFQAAALGNYEELDKVLADIEKVRAANRAHTLATAVVLNALNLNVAGELPPAARTITLGHGLARLLRTSDDLVRPEADLITLRGMMALEYGDTAAARGHFEAALRLTGPDNYFQDRPIAQRYLELLREGGR